MGSFKIFRRQTGRLFATVGLLAATIVPGFVPSLASAAIVSDRSIEMSSSSKGAEDVTYKITFTPATTGGGAFAVIFCSNSPVPGESCTAPTGMDVTDAGSTTTGFTDTTGPAANRIVVADAVTKDEPAVVEVTGITNPTTAGTFYARIVTYDTSTNASADLTGGGTGAVDNGGVALSATDTIGVSGRVLESLVFCVSGPTSEEEATNPNPIEAGCKDTGGHMTAPTLHLGDKIGDNYVLSADKVSSGDIYTQLSTNAISGVVVSLKNANSCGGLMRTGATTCDIPATLANDITDNQGTAAFGVKVAADTTTDTAESASGTLQAINGYSSSAYALNYTSGGAGVTSPYGDHIMDTGESTSAITQPVNRNMKLTFGATVANNTPAGLYSADLSLVATGKF